jgi:hypothetical protein
VDVQRAGRRAPQQAADLRADLAVAVGDDVRRVAELARGVDAGAGHGPARGAHRRAQALERARTLDGVGHDRRGVLDERLVDVVLDRAVLLRLGPRHDAARLVGEHPAGRVEQQQLLLHAEGIGRRSAEPVLHRVGIIGSRSAWIRARPSSKSSAATR